MSLPSDDVLGRPTDLLRFVGRINRVRFIAATFLLQIAVTAPCLAFFFVVQWLASSAPASTVAPANAAIVLAMLTVNYFVIAGICTQRAHDIGWQGKRALPALCVSAICGLISTALMLLIPDYPAEGSLVLSVVAIPGGIVMLLLVLLPGQKGDNEFGPAPKPA